MDYKSTLQLPTTDFPMKANLREMEPRQLKRWQEIGLYQKMVAQNRKAMRFTLHDGPPYANGSIHLGTSLNKILKDMVVKYHHLNGELSEYVPGWDCHGLPIELKVIKEMGKEAKALSVNEFRRAAREYARRYVNIQRDEFQRLGVLGDWQNPYLTMDPAYQASIVREFGKIVAQDLVTRQKKPVYWCWHCQTALAEAEVEYENHTSPSIYVAFPLSAVKDATSVDKNIHALIWTTTPWTLVANLAIAFNPRETYKIAYADGRGYIMAEKRMVEVIEATDLKLERTAPLPAALKTLDQLSFNHPFIDRKSRGVYGDHVTMETGTGCVHTAPGHGQEDYEVGRKYAMEAYAPVDEVGKFTADAGEFAGQQVFKANDAIIKKLQDNGKLIHASSITHSYPHCWRCKNPVIFRATEQWFIGMEKNDLRKRALKALTKVEWIPKWGIDRIQGMLEARPDWCISRQRSWGVPIVVWRCRSCGESLCEPKLIDSVADKIAAHPQGADLWFEDVTSATDPLLPKGQRCKKCQGGDLQRGMDILDVWFDSGVSYTAVLENKLELKLPCDLYLEGSDQHRGWFHSTLLAALARGEKAAPYKAVLTHGFVVDGQGRKMSKSLGNTMNALEMIDKRGAEILRLWVASEDYQNDIRVSEEIITRLTESYRRIRNTCRFLLGNLHKFDPDRHIVAYEKMPELERFQLLRLTNLIEQVRKAYADYSFHLATQALHHFCVVDLSSFYLDVTKDSLYTNPENSLERRAAQTVIYYTVRDLCKLLAPVLSFTAEEVWQHLPKTKDHPTSVFLTQLPEIEKKWQNKGLNERWQELSALRSEVLKELEKKRADKLIGSALEAAVTIGLPKAKLKDLNSYQKDLANLCIVSELHLNEQQGDGAPSITVTRATGIKCERCWVYKHDVGKNNTHPTLCERCVNALN